MTATIEGPHERLLSALLYVSYEVGAAVHPKCAGEKINLPGYKKLPS